MIQFNFLTSAKPLDHNNTAVALFDTTKKALRFLKKGPVLEKVKKQIDAIEYKGKAGEALLFRGLDSYDFDNVLVLGSGVLKTSENYKKLGAYLYKSVTGSKTKNNVFSLENFGGERNVENISAFFEGAYLASYNVDHFKTKKNDKKKSDDTFKINVVGTAAQISLAKKAHETAQTLSECINFARKLGDTPGNLMTPEDLAKAAVGEAKNSKLKVTVWDKARIKKENMGSFLGVALGMDGGGPEPRFILMEYNGGPKSKKPICFVGKGLTFDSGGISIKPAAGMQDMKYDMCGGANVIATMLAIAKLKLKVNAIAYVPSTENMLGPLANKPGDILTARNGKTIEVNNTDAEGRLILADALVYACEQNPACIVDIATLTGAMTVALGNTHTGYFSKDNSLCKKVEKAADKSGESIWRMPVTDDHLDDMKGTFADLSNMGATRFAGSAQAAAFLYEFVDPKIPYVHFDVAGTAWYTGTRLPYNPAKGASGVMIKTFVELAKIY